MKRFIDTLIVILFAPLWLPVLAVAALGVRIAMGRPVLFRQERIGLGNRPFTIFKLRPMRTGEGSDAERLTPFGRSTLPNSDGAMRFAPASPAGRR